VRLSLEPISNNKRQTRLRRLFVRQQRMRLISSSSFLFLSHLDHQARRSDDDLA